MAKKPNRFPGLRKATARGTRSPGAKVLRTFIQRSRGGATAEQKATFHQVDGAGRRRVLRPFLGLSPAEEREIGDRLDVLIDQQIRRAS